MGQPDHPQRVGDDADRRARVVAGEEAQLGAVDRADPGEVALVEQCLAERARGVGGQPSDGLLLVPVGAEQVGAEVADDVVLAFAGEELDDPEADPRDTR